MGPVFSLSNLLREETPLIPKGTDDFFSKNNSAGLQLTINDIKRNHGRKKESNAKNSKCTLTYANQSRSLISTSCFFVVQLYICVRPACSALK